MLKEKIFGDLKVAMKAKDETRVSTLRLVLAAITNKEITKREGDKPELNDEEIISVLSSEVKRRTDAIQQYTAGNRPDLAEKERKEKTILESYLPQQLSDEELTTLVEKAIKESGATTQKDFGAVMKVLMPNVKGRAQGNRVSDTVKKQLTQE